MSYPDGSKIPGYDISQGPLSMLLAGSVEKRSEAEAVVSAVGFKPQFVGPIRYAKNLEAIAELWIHSSIPADHLSNVQWGAGFHFNVVGR